MSSQRTPTIFDSFNYAFEGLIHVLRTQREELLLTIGAPADAGQTLVREWETTGRIASLMGSMKIESRGPQNHNFTKAEFDRRYLDHFG